MTTADTYRARDAFIQGRDEEIEKAAPSDAVPYMQFGPDTQRHEIPFDQVFPRRVAQTALIGDSPAPVEDEPQLRGRQDINQHPGERSESWTTGVGSTQLGPNALGSTTRFGDGFDMGAPIAMSQEPRRMVALSGISETARAGDRPEPYTGDWLQMSDRAPAEKAAPVTKAERRAARSLTGF